MDVIKVTKTLLTNILMLTYETKHDFWSTIFLTVA